MKAYINQDNKINIIILYYLPTLRLQIYSTSIKNQKINIIFSTQL